MAIFNISRAAITVVALLFAPTAAFAGTLSGEGALAASQTSGNTSTTALGASLKLRNEAGPWVQTVEIRADYANADDVTTANRLFGALQIGRDFNETFYGFGRVSNNRDRFTGYKNQLFFGAGLGMHVLTGPKATWDLEVSPGYQIDTFLLGGSSESFALQGISRFGYKFNDAVSLQNDTNIGYAETSTLIGNITSVTAKLSEKLAARMSYEIAHQTSPLPGTEATDTATKVSLVYGF
jgi:putative salt-induced outer membrane protein